MLVATIVLATTYVGIAFTRLPRVNIDRPAAALAGAVVMLLAGVLTFPQAVAAIDFNTLALLLGMMLLVVVLQRGGFFTLLATRAIAVADSPGKLMVSVVVVTAALSAFLVNDVVVLLFTPVVIQACRLARVNPIPYLIGEAMASNIGSTATIVGNPQNMLIGVASGISFPRFFAYLAPVAAVSTLLLLAVLWAFYRKEMARRVTDPQDPPGGGGATAVAVARPLVEVDYSVLRRSVPVLVLAVIGFFLSPTLGLGIPLVSLAAGVVAMLVSGIRPSEVIRNVDWVLLLFFGGLFVVIGGARQAGVLDALLQRVDMGASVGGILSIHLFSTVVSQIVSNVPLTLLMLPLLQGIPGHTLWVSLAAGATLGGNATIIGAVSNIIVAEQAYREGVLVRFGEFLKVGLVVTGLTLAASIGILVLEFQTGLLR
ncbi:MAG: anion transporter [Chloroflexi bacterium]|nr:anion transporter [Chloroflexota bacterium]